MATGTLAQRNIWTEIIGSGSAVMAVGVIGILMVMIIPLPTWMLDILLSVSIMVSIVVLLMSLYVMKPLDFSVFPSVLLTVTLLRLALNVASARLILLHGSEGTGAAGQVIKSFGTFVVGGNYVVGFIVFSVLVLINFIVITKGATRVAEVAARFTLDAMPGKQMSIDADLNTGLITDTEARRRRLEIESEATFYGAMDGASKFVRGDAIAGIIIVLVNLVGGLIVGVLQQNMAIADAARTYSLLTIGDGLVTQVPALIVSTAAGMLVTRTAGSGDLGDQIHTQVFSQPRAIAIAAVMLFTFALIPGMPKMAFIVVAFGTAIMAWNLLRKGHAVSEAVDEEEVPVAALEPQDLITPVDPMGLEVGYGLIPLVDASQGGELLQRIKALRKQLASEMGFIVPSIHIRDNLQLRPNEYAVMMKGVEIAKGELLAGHYMAITPEDPGPEIQGIRTREPAFGLPAIWVSEEDRDSVQAAGLVVVDAATVITTHLTELIKNNVDELLGRMEVQTLIDGLANLYPKVIEEIVPKIVPIGVLQKVLQRLLRERVSIRDLITIIETLADYVPMTKNADILVGYVRQALARSITRQYIDDDGNIVVMMVAPDVEEAISKAVQHMEFESFVTPDPNMASRLIGSVQNGVGQFTSRGVQPVLLSSPNVRIHLRKIIERFFPNVMILSHNEIARDANIMSIGMIEA
ncbi:MAG: Flagellar biosynthesis protein FlhA [Syntrophus sp. SKADARSKE-3]|nr:Flagellar biosynthesis protein FlhA [Syntrophus sp. SKADARSKE-3]